MDTVNTWAENLEGLPGYDYVVDFVNDKAGDKFQTKDPFYVEIDGNKKKRKAPETCSKDSRKAWKKIQKRAWMDDRNFFGCFPIDIGLGLAPLFALIPVFGPLLMYAIHARLITIASQHFKLPIKLVTKMHGNVLMDLLISLPPIIGSFLAWMNACSTRNAALIHTFIVEEELKIHPVDQTQTNAAVDLNYTGNFNPNLHDNTDNHSTNYIQKPIGAHNSTTHSNLNRTVY